MYITHHIFTLKLGAVEGFVKEFAAVRSVDSFPGFIKRELLIGPSTKEVEEVIFVHYWEIKEAFMNWHNSDAHRQGHKNAGKKNEAVIKVEKKGYNVVSTINHD